jgi:hypothetical protein
MNPVHTIPPYFLKIRFNTEWAKINAGISNMNYLFTSSGTARKPATLLSPPLTVSFLLIMKSPASALMDQTSLFQEDRGRLVQVSWPPGSTDLISVNFYSWGYTKGVTYSKKPTSVEELRERESGMRPQCHSRNANSTLAKTGLPYGGVSSNRSTHIEFM